MKIGVFDSGLGGLSVAKAIKVALPEDEIIFREDRAHAPYGTKTPDEILELVLPILQVLVEEGCEVIVIACNTVTTTLIDTLRERFDVPLVAVEPMVKPAAEQTRSKIIAVCATPATLQSPRYAWLKQTYAQGITVLEPDCSDWVPMIEADTVNTSTIAQRIEEVLEGGADVIILGCTHYHWIEAEINQLAAGKATVLQPEQPLIEQLKRVMQTIS